MTQEWFEMQDVRRRFYSRAVWIPLRAAKRDKNAVKYGYAGYKEEFFGVGSVAVPFEKKADAEFIDWQELGIRSNHCGVWQDDMYQPAAMYKPWRHDFIGEHLVLDQLGEGAENHEWHLNQDLAITLGLKREGDNWVRPEDGYTVVVRLTREEDGDPALIEIRSSYLRDYLCARKMALRITSYRQRDEVTETDSHIDWENGEAKEETETDRWEGRVDEIHEGGIRYGEEIAVFHAGRTDVDPEEDVPEFDFPTDENIKTESWTKKHSGRKLFRTNGELWRNEWIDPADSSPIVLGDDEEPTASFITDASGTRENKRTLEHGIKWLWFSPGVVNAILEGRGSALGWYTQETGRIACLEGHGVHFGMNSLGLINVLAKDIALLPNWHQNIWAGYNIAPDGKVSKELLSSQMSAVPADTQAPEDFFGRGIEAINYLSEKKLGFPIFNDHQSAADILKKIHRFRSTDKSGLYALSKDIARLTADQMNTAELQRLVPPPKGQKWGSLKSLENLLAQYVQPAVARRIMGSLAGAYELRLGDAHLPSSEIDEALSLVNIDSSKPYVIQGYQLLNSCVSSLYGVLEVIKDIPEQT